MSRSVGPVVLLCAAFGLVACSSDSTLSSSTEVDDTSAASTTSSVVDVTDTSTTTLPGPPTTPAATTPPVTAAPTAAPTAPPATAAPTAAPTGPRITSASFTEPAACAAPDVSFVGSPPTVTITWTAVNADSVYVAIGNRDGPFETNLPLSGSYTLPYACPGPVSFWVVAVKGDEKDYRGERF